MSMCYFYSKYDSEVMARTENEYRDYCDYLALSLSGVDVSERKVRFMEDATMKSLIDRVIGLHNVAIPEAVLIAK